MSIWRVGQSGVGGEAPWLRPLKVEFVWVGLDAPQIICGWVSTRLHAMKGAKTIFNVCIKKIKHKCSVILG